MYTINTNASGSKHLTITEEHLRTIEHYQLFRNLIDSNGIVDESVLDKLKLTVRSLLANAETTNRSLIDLCLDVLYHNNMKAYGLHQLIQLYTSWQEQRTEE